MRDTPFSRFLEEFRRNKVAAVAAVIVSLIVFIALIAPLITLKTLTTSPISCCVMHGGRRVMSARADTSIGSARIRKGATSCRPLSTGCASRCRWA